MGTGTLRGALIGFLALAAAGCGGSSSREGQQAEDRWPETGSFSYDFTTQFNGVRCATGRHEFSRKSEYCMALRDRSLNSGCAIRARFETYTTECGDDFEETRIGGMRISGYDPALGRSCETAPTPGIFDTASQYCAFLRDESAHQHCFWVKRKIEFMDTQCKGSFSEPPAPMPNPTATATTTPMPTPTSTLTPVPTPTPTQPPVDERPEVVRELEAAGIRVQVIPPQHPFPGERPFQERLRGFWRRLERLKGELLRRKDVIRELSVTSYTSYDSQRKDLSVDVDLSEGDLSAYFGLLDRRLNWERLTGILLDLGIEIYGHEADRTAELKARIEFFEKNLRGISSLQGLVRKIEFGDYAHYSLRERAIRVRKESYAEVLAGFQASVGSAANFFRFADGIGLEIEGDLDPLKEPQAFIAVFERLADAKEAVASIRRLGMLQKLEVSRSRNETRFWDHLKELWVATSGPALDMLPRVLGALEIEGRRSRELGLPFETSLDKLDANYLEVISRLESRFQAIRAKKRSIRGIHFSFQSDFSSGWLWIGYQDPVSRLDEVIRRIP